MKIYIYILCLSFLASCNKEIKHTKIQIQFKQNMSFEKNAYLKIDNHTFKHNRYIDSLNSYLPNHKITIIKHDKEFTESTNNIYVGMSLAKKIIATKDYKIDNKQRILIEGVIELSRLDKKPILISHSENYPIIIKNIN